jgi:transcriptional regulator with GAF, ATPase, and Fis domain
MTTGPSLDVQTIDLMTQNLGPSTVRTLEEAERAHITETLRETNWVVGGPRGAAARLGLARTTFIAMMQRLGICREASRFFAGPFLKQTQPGRNLNYWALWAGYKF